MIYIKDDFLDNNLFNQLTNYLNNFKEVKTYKKSFWVMPPPDNLINYIELKLNLLENKRIKNILAFFRQAKKNQDNDWRIHNDTIIENQLPDRALVLYMTDNEKNLNGTAFWEHKEKGDKVNKIDTEEFNNIILKDSNNKDKWILKSIIGAKKNRLISYPCNYFHSKYPNEFNKERIVFVMFYKYVE
tara:strand:- start:393 stop:953 length:561 start_codon:yes stop_codon:yes gene_type:complete